jgi:hypothetical protein
MLLVYVTAGPRALLRVVYEPGAHITLQCNAGCREEKKNRSTENCQYLFRRNGTATPLGEIPAHVLNCRLLSLFPSHSLPACSASCAPLQYFNDAVFILPAPTLMPVQCTYSLCSGTLKSAALLPDPSRTNYSAWGAGIASGYGPLR